MKRTIAILLALVLMFSAALPAFAIDDEEVEIFGIAKGYVRTKEVYKNSDGSSVVIVRSYNDQGKLVKEKGTCKEPEKASISTTKYTYNEKGNLIKETTVNTYSDSPTERETVTYTYNKAGLLAQAVYDMGESSHTLKYTYDKKGNRTKEVNYMNDSICTTTWAYDAKGNLTKEASKTVYEDNTKNTDTTTYTYDNKGNQTKMVHVFKSSIYGYVKQTESSIYNNKGLCTQTIRTMKDVGNNYQYITREVTTYIYDKNDNITEETTKGSANDGTKWTVSYVSTYDAKGNLIKESSLDKRADSVIKSNCAYIYDAKGNLSKSTRTSKDNDGVRKVTVTYTYDKAGNLTKEVYAFKNADGSSGKDVTIYRYQKIGA